jgi:hypothetical protein
MGLIQKRNGRPARCAHPKEIRTNNASKFSLPTPDLIEGHGGLPEDGS